jgi:hypothetical protein
VTSYVCYLQVLIFFQSRDAKIGPNLMCTENKSITSLREHKTRELVAKIRVILARCFGDRADLSIFRPKTTVYPPEALRLQNEL